MKLNCAHCQKPLHKSIREVNRARKIGANLYCDLRCAGMARRSGKTQEQKVEEKRLYDAAYRTKNREILKMKKSAYFQRTYDPVRAAKERKKRMRLHVEYCRQPRYKAWKREYDRKYRAREYGPFAEAYTLAINLNREIKSRMSSYEIRIQNQTLNKRQTRSRAAQEIAGRDRNSRAKGQRFEGRAVGNLD